MLNLSENTMNMTEQLGIRFPTPLPIFRAAPNKAYLTGWVNSQSTPMLRRIAGPAQYNDLVRSFIAPNYGIDCSGYTIPKIIPPYRLHTEKGRSDLQRAIELGKIGDRSPYPANDVKVKNLLSKPTVPRTNFFYYKEPRYPIEKQIDYDRAVMLGNQEEIDQKKQVNIMNKHQQELQKIPVSAPEEIERNASLQI